MDNAIETVLAAVRQHGRDLKAYRDLGRIRAVLSPDAQFVLFNYTEEAQFGGQLTPVEEACRGLIVHVDTAELRALPFPKFYNLGQTPESSLENLPRDGFEVTTKLDGSLGILYRDSDDELRFATRGSFTSEQAEWATRYWDEHYSHVDVPHVTTLLFEIIYPENRVVIRYDEKQAGLYLIGARRMTDGHDYDYYALARWAEQWSIPVTKNHRVEDLVDLVETARDLSGTEGFVIRFQGGRRVKLKTDEYVQLHRLLTGFGPERVRQAMLQGEERYIEYAALLPDEFYRDAKRYHDMLRWAVDELDLAVERRYWQIKDQFAPQEPTRKEFALEAIKDPQLAPYLFANLDGKPYRDRILKGLDLEALFGTVATSKEDVA